MTTNHKQTTTNDQTDFFRIQIIYFFRKLETRRSTLHNSENIELFIL